MSDARKRRTDTTSGSSSSLSLSASKKTKEEVDCETHIPLTRMACATLFGVLILMVIFQLFVGVPPDNEIHITTTARRNGNGNNGENEAVAKWYLPSNSIGRIYKHDGRFDDVMDMTIGDSSMEVLADGFKWPEGLVWVSSIPSDARATSGHLTLQSFPRGPSHARLVSPLFNCMEQVHYCSQMCKTIEYIVGHPQIWNKGFVCFIMHQVMKVMILMNGLNLVVMDLLFIPTRDSSLFVSMGIDGYPNWCKFSLNHYFSLAFPSPPLPCLTLWCTASLIAVGRWQSLQ
jgi:hypothetical protein